MSSLAFLSLSVAWAFLIWAIAVVTANKFTALDTWSEYWLAALTACFVPPVFSGVFIVFGAHVPDAFVVAYELENFPIVDTIFNNAKLGAVFENILHVGLSIYLVGVGVAVLRLYYGWRRLIKAVKHGQCRAIAGHSIIVTDMSLPPCTYGFFRPVILMPKALCGTLPLNMQSCIIKHEAAHIRFYDPAIMLGLYIVRALCWPHPAIHDLVKRWTIAIELRADNFALAGVNKHIRKEYGQTLVKVLRDLSAKANRGALPCPSATLNLSNYRSAKMRVENILNEKPKPYKSRRQKINLGVLSLSISLIGAVGLTASAGPAISPDRDAQPSVRFPPIFPANCVANEGKFAASVNVKFDVSKDGSVENIRVTKSDNPCFDQATINSVAKWQYKPVLEKGKARKRQGVQSMIKYMKSPENDK